MGNLEQNVIDAIPDDKLEELLTDPTKEKTVWRLHTLAYRLGIQGKDFLSIRTKAGEGLKALIISAASGAVPEGKELEKKDYKKHAQSWFKTGEGGRELAAKIFTLDAWPTLKPQLMPFCNAVRLAAGVTKTDDLLL